MIRAKLRHPVVWAFLLYTLLAIVGLWALVSRFGSAVPYAVSTDYYQFHWNYWWMQTAMTGGLDMARSDYVLYPHMNDLVLHTLTPIWLPVYMIIEPLLGRHAALNLMVLLSFPLTGVTMAVWLRRVLTPLLTSPAGRGGNQIHHNAGHIVWGMAILGGLVYAFSPYMLDHAANSHLNLTALWWFPLALLLWDEIAFEPPPTDLRSAPSPASRGGSQVGHGDSTSPLMKSASHWGVSRPVLAVLMGLALWGMALSDLQYAIWLPFLLGPVVLWTLWAKRRARAWLPLVLWGAVAVGIGLVLIYVWPLHALLQVEGSSNPYEFPPAGLHTVRWYALPPSALVGLAPVGDDRTLGRVFVWLMWLAVMGGVGAIRAGLSPAPTLKPASDGTRPNDGRQERPWPSRWFWLIFAVPPLLLSLGPDLFIGETRIVLPYLWLHDLFAGQYRNPVRFGQPAVVLLLTFAVLVFTPLLLWIGENRRGRRLVPVLLGGVALVLLIDGGLFAPFPATVLPQYDVHQTIAAEEADFVVLDVPVGTHNGWTGIGTGHYTMYYGPDHEHRAVNGTLSRTPWSTLNDYMESPLFSWLAGTADLVDEEAAVEFQTYLAEWPVGYVIAYLDWLTEEQRQAYLPWLNGQAGLCPAEANAEATVLYWRAEHLGCDPAQTTTIPLGGPLSWLYLGPGWYRPENVGGPAARWVAQAADLRVVLDPAVAYDLVFQAAAFGEGRTVTIQAGDWTSDPISLTNDWQTYTVPVPAGTVVDGWLRLVHNAAEESADGRLLAAAYSELSFAPSSGE